jgi:hypothetical protein
MTMRLSPPRVRAALRRTSPSRTTASSTTAKRAWSSPTTTLTAIDTIRILKNEFRQNGGEGLVFGHGTGAIGRRGLDRNVAIEGNTFDRNVQARCQ